MSHKAYDYSDKFKQRFENLDDEFKAEFNKKQRRLVAIFFLLGVAVGAIGSWIL